MHVDTAPKRNRPVVCTCTAVAIRASGTRQFCCSQQWCFPGAGHCPLRAACSWAAAQAKLRLQGWAALRKLLTFHPLQHAGRPYPHALLLLSCGPGLALCTLGLLSLGRNCGLPGGPLGILRVLPLLGLPGCSPHVHSDPVCCVLLCRLGACTPALPQHCSARFLKVGVLVLVPPSLSRALLGKGSLLWDPTAWPRGLPAPGVRLHSWLGRVTVCGGSSFNPASPEQCQFPSQPMGAHQLQHAVAGRRHGPRCWLERPPPLQPVPVSHLQLSQWLSWNPGVRVLCPGAADTACLTARAAAGCSQDECVSAGHAGSAYA